MSSLYCGSHPPALLIPPLPVGQGFVVQLDLRAGVSDVLLLNDGQRAIALCLLHQGEGGRSGRMRDNTANRASCSLIGLMMCNILIQQLANHFLVGSAVFLGFCLEKSNALCA